MSIEQKKLFQYDIASCWHKASKFTIKNMIQLKTFEGSCHTLRWCHHSPDLIPLECYWERVDPHQNGNWMLKVKLPPVLHMQRKVFQTCPTVHKRENMSQPSEQIILIFVMAEISESTLFRVIQEDTTGTCLWSCREEYEDMIMCEELVDLIRSMT